MSGISCIFIGISNWFDDFKKSNYYKDWARWIVFLDMLDMGDLAAL
ncbi:hypothetical protein KVE35_06140 [Helicobacter pylori]|nr:hypothetical protein KVE35_06140 [Helicobacter pylori]